LKQCTKKYLEIINDRLEINNKLFLKMFAIPEHRNCRCVVVFDIVDENLFYEKDLRESAKRFWNKHKANLSNYPDRCPNCGNYRRRTLEGK
jgi:hypothetical protein